MLDKEYLDKLKKEDYIAFDNLINDPMVTGSDSNINTFVFVVSLILIIISVFGIYLI